MSALPRRASQYVASRLFTYVGNSVYATIGPLIAATMFDANAAQIGLITATSLVVSLLLRIPVASLADRAIDERRLMIVWGLLAAAVSALTPILWLAGGLNFWSFLGCVLLAAACSAVLSSVGFRVVNRLAPHGQRTRLVGQLNGAQSVGSIVGQSFGGLLIGVMPPPLATLLDSGMSLLGVATMPKMERGAEHGAPAVAVVPGANPARDQAVTLVAVWRAALNSASLRLAISVGIAGSLLEPVVVLYLLRVAGLDPAFIGLAFGAGAVGGVLGGAIVGRTVEWAGSRNTMLIGIASMLVGTVVLLILGDNRGLEFASAAVFELGTAFGGVLIVASAMGELQEQTDPERISRTMTAAAVAMEGTGIAGIGLGALLASVAGLFVPFYVAIAIYALILLYVLVATLRDTRRQEAEQRPHTTSVPR